MTQKVTRLDTRPTDADLVALAKAGDMGAQEMLFHRHLKLVSGLAFRLLGADDEVDDIVQESFMLAFSKLHSLQEGQAFASWLSAITVGTTTGVIRRRRLLSRLGLRRRETVRPEALIAPHAPPEIILELKSIYELLQKLPTDERVILILRRVEELSLDEIADRTGWSVATVKRRLTRVEQRLSLYLAASRGPR